MFVSIEGSDGCGKDTIAAELAKRMKDEVEVINFPNDDAVTGPMIRDYLSRRWSVVSSDASLQPGKGQVAQDIQRSALAFQALQVTNRMELMPKLINAAGNATQHVIAVRYWQSAWVYGQLDGLDPEWLHHLHSTMVQPVLNVLLDIDAETSMARRAARDGDKNPERYEGKLKFTEQVVDLYRALWKSQESPYGSYIKVDATQSIGYIVQEILERMVLDGTI